MEEPATTAACEVLARKLRIPSWPLAVLRSLEQDMQRQRWLRMDVAARRRHLRRRKLRSTPGRLRQQIERARRQLAAHGIRVEAA
jgi:hypothetical protein